MHDDVLLIDFSTTPHSHALYSCFFHLPCWYSFQFLSFGNTLFCILNARLGGGTDQQKVTMHKDYWWNESQLIYMSIHVCSCNWLTVKSTRSQACFINPGTNKTIYALNYSFSPGSIRDWNVLPRRMRQVETQIKGLYMYSKQALRECY